jgi:lactoylglutathione lyase
MSTESPAESSSTAGYKLNHFMLRITNPTRTLHFYVTLMGMRVIFTRDVGPMTVYYLGYPQGDAHRSDPETFAKDTSKHEVLTQTLGLLEIVHFRTIEEDESGKEGSGQVDITSGSEGGNLGFNHLGFTVPDVGKTVERLRKEGVQVVKDAGEGPNEVVPITNWETMHGASDRELSEGFGKLFRQLGFVRDPVSVISHHLLRQKEC